MILFYVRHGDPVYAPDSLTPLGRRQAEAVAKRLALYGVDRIFASTSERAIQTAQPAGEIMKKQVELLDFCNESHAWARFTVPNESGGQGWLFQNQKMIRLFADREIFRLGDAWYEHPALRQYHFQQSVEWINRETDAFFLSLGYEHIRERGVYQAVKPNEQRIALFAHQGFGLSFLSSLLGIPYPQFCIHFDMGHTGMTVIEFREEDGLTVPKVLTMSNDSHIYKEGLPTFYNNTVRF